MQFQPVSENPDTREVAHAITILQQTVVAEFQTLWAKIYALEAELQKTIKASKAAQKLRTPTKKK